MTSLKTSIKTITYLSDTGCLEIQGASLLNPDDVAKKVLRACLEGKVRTVEDQDIDIHFSSVCVHSDTPGALSLLIAINKALREADISVNSQN